MSKASTLGGRRAGAETKEREMKGMGWKDPGSTALKARQMEVVSTAVTQGYFEFPRRISLTGLSELVGVKPSTLSEILRSAERRILASALSVPPK